ncbi:hypothetical protein HDU83_009959 [Entophlyctis luteolus]|nr:hypothetical protein HDU83_009959 [Entophlyctis luteolus]
MSGTVAHNPAAAVAFHYSDAVLLHHADASDDASILTAWAAANRLNAFARPVIVKRAVPADSAIAASVPSRSVVLNAADPASLVPWLAAAPSPPTVFYANAGSLASATALASIALSFPVVVVLAASDSADDLHNSALAVHAIARSSKTNAILVSAFVPRGNRSSAAATFPEIDEISSSSEETDIARVESALASLKVSPKLPFFSFTGPSSPSTVVVIPGTAPTHFERNAPASVGVLRVRVLKPWSTAHFLSALPQAVQTVAVVEFGANGGAFGSLFLDVVASIPHDRGITIRELRVKGDAQNTSVVRAVFEATTASTASFVDVNGDSTTAPSRNIVAVSEADIEGPYVSLLSQVFKERLNLANVIGESSLLQKQTNEIPAVTDAFTQFVEKAKALVASGTFSKGVSKPLQAWVDALDSRSENHADLLKLGRKALEVLGAACSYKSDLREFYDESRNFLLKPQPQPQPLSSQPEKTTASPKNAGGTSAEFGLGLLLSQIQERNRFIAKATELASSPSLPQDVKNSLSAWLSAEAKEDSRKVGKEAFERLSAAADSDRSLQSFVDAAKEYLTAPRPSRWLLGGDRLTHDINASGVHHAIASKQNVNILLLDTEPYSEKVDSLASRAHRKNVGLYAMTYGGVYVASVALQSSFAGVVRALTEADSFNGPSVVIAYAPRVSDVPAPSLSNGILVKGGAGLAATAALASLKETKRAIDEGYWPLYRWTPGSGSADNVFKLDSEKMRGELEAFLERDRLVSMVAASEPVLMGVASSVEQELRENVEQKIKNSYRDLISGLNTTPVLVLYGSDGGAAAGAAKRLVAEAKQRGLKPKISVMDEYAVEDIALHEHVVFVVSTAGQGEFPGNARETWKALQGLKNGGDIDFSKTRFAVFAMGDSHYWPLPSDAHFFCKSGKDLDAKLEAVGAQRLVVAGIGNDRDADGWQTGYRKFTEDLWASLGVDSVEVAGAAAMVGTDDAIKEASNFLRGTIAPGLEDTSTGALAELDQRLTKFHGIYQQDDRDIREGRLRAGLEPAYSFMVRVRVPGGVATPAQWVAVDEVSDRLANGTIKLTTRQAFQFHGIIKSKLKKAIQEINHALMDTLAACGDVNRNVMCNPNPTNSLVHLEVLDFSRKLSNHLTPNTNAYHEIWLDKKLAVTSEDVEPIYGKTYLPRKFKVAVAVPPHNDVDVFAHDLGYIAVTEGDRLVGFNVTVGGGMGMTHGMKGTYPRLADILGFCTVAEAVNVGEKVVLVQRDFGDRTNRKHARLKYTIDDRGIDWFRKEVEDRLGYKMQPARPYKFTSNGDRYGWSEGLNNTWSYTMFIQNGRVKDDETRMAKTGLRAIADDFVRRDVKGVEFRLTPNQHLIISGVPAAEKWKLEAFLKKYDLENSNMSGLRQNSMACVALPTCALAFAESERYLPDLVGKIDEVLFEHGLKDNAITIRMTGCPNGCARPQIAEIAFIGKAPGTYNMYLGGGFNGERLNKLYKENVTEPEIIALLTPIIRDYAKTRIDGEHFGDFVIRKGYVKATTAGKNFHDL